MTTSHKNVAARNKSLIAVADKAVAAYESELDAAYVSARAKLAAALDAAYAVIFALQGSPDERAAFLAERGVKPHGNTKNPHQPLTRALFSKVKRCRSDVARFAATFALAVTRNVQPKDFLEWLNGGAGPSDPQTPHVTKHGVDAKAAIYAASQRAPKAAADSATQREDRIKGYIQSLSRVSGQTLTLEHPPKPRDTKALPGVRRLGVVEYQKDGTANLVLIDMHPSDVLNLLDREAQRTEQGAARKQEVRHAA